MSQKHPRVCGEESFPLVVLVLRLETPPRVWGRISLVLDLAGLLGNTPACVGKNPAPLDRPLEN